MLVEVKTRKGVRVTLNTENVSEQTKVINTASSETYYSIAMASGATMELGSPVTGIAIAKTITKVAPQVVIRRPTDTSKKPLPKVKYESVMTPVTGPLNIGRPGREEDSETKYRGEMIYTHKTAPELLIKDSDGNIVKDVDVKKMYRRRD